jgi:hypothetical protein
MRFYELKPIKPITPQQSRIANLKRNAEIAKQALASERRAQQVQKAQATIKKLSKKYLEYSPRTRLIN